MAGDGEVIPNGSIHWRIVQRPGGKVGAHHSEGTDPTPVSKVGSTKRHKGRFRVRLRFKTREDALKAVAQAQRGMRQDKVSRMFEIALDVPPVKRTRKQAAGPSPNRYAQIRIDW
jgi:hypothetical protein